MQVPTNVGETTITGKNQISLPAQGVKKLGWQKGDRLLVQVLGEDMMMLIRRRGTWTETFSGKMGHVWGDHEDTLRYLEEERRSWEKDQE
jgi:bifunctional DNA-binding transcriptional regulator/antitoxin component of YhaV-PrlF toxin-antitoxin module